MRRARTAWRSIAVVVALLTMAGCTSGVDGAAEQPDDEPAAEAPAPAPSPPPEPDPAPPEPDRAPSSCDDAVLAAATSTVSGQLAAFARRDFAGALGFASSSFRAGTDLASFQRLIETGYPEVASPTQHVVLACAQPDSTSVQLLVSVTGGAGTTDELVYLLVDEDGRWGIAAAASRERTGSLA